MPDLNCTAFEERLIQAVEARESLAAFEDECDPQSAPWQELRAHAHQCPDCRKLWNEFALLERVLPVWKSQLPPVDLAERVLARWREEQTSFPATAEATKTNGRKNSSWAFPWSVVLAVAALVLVSIPFVFPPSSDPDPSETIAISHPAPEPAGNDQNPPPPNLKDSEAPSLNPDWQELAQDAGSAYWALASDAADSFASVTVFVPPRKAASEPPKPEDPPPAGGWVEGIGTGLKPIGQDVKKSMGFLFEALPTDPPTI
jgi:hypothetical protein